MVAREDRKSWDGYCIVEGKPALCCPGKEQRSLLAETLGLIDGPRDGELRIAPDVVLTGWLSEQKTAITVPKAVQEAHPPWAAPCFSPLI